MDCLRTVIWVRAGKAPDEYRVRPVPVGFDPEPGGAADEEGGLVADDEESQGNGADLEGSGRSF